MHLETVLKNWLLRRQNMTARPACPGKADIGLYSRQNASANFVFTLIYLVLP
jgi:hypothetical protein